MPGADIAGAGGIGTMIALFIFAVVAGLVGLIVGSVPLHIGVIVMGGRGGFVQTFKAVVDGLTPYYLLGWIPIVGWLAGLRGLVVEIFGIRELHDMTTGRAVIAWVIPIASAFIITAILVLIVGVALFALSGIASSSEVIPVVTVVTVPS